MSISLYKASVPIFIQFLNALSSVLDKGAAFAEARKIDPEVLTGLRIYPDMHPLAWQVRSTTTHAVRACALIAGVEQPEFGDAQTTIPELKDRIAKAVDFLKTIKPDQMNGKEDKEIVLNFGSARIQVHGVVVLVEFLAAELLFPRYDVLRHPAPMRRRYRQTRLHGNAGRIVGDCAERGRLRRRSNALPQMHAVLRRQVIFGAGFHVERRVPRIAIARDAVNSELRGAVRVR